MQNPQISVDCEPRSLSTEQNYKRFYYHPIFFAKSFRLVLQVVLQVKIRDISTLSHFQPFCCRSDATKFEGFLGKKTLKLDILLAKSDK
jgi:hypothetical protein